MRRIGKAKGGAIVFVVVLALVLIALGVGFFLISLYFGGAQETKEAVNSGALNVAKKSLDITIDISGDPDQQFFKDCTDNGKVSLRNINKVWAKALFVAINAEGAKNDGGHDGSASSSVTSALSGAEAIGASLAAKLNDANNLYDFFNQYAMANSVRMLGVGTHVEALKGSNWKTASLELGHESNIEVSDNWPVGYSNSALQTPSLRKPVPTDASGKQYIKGYEPLKVYNSDFWMVAYPFELKPHLVDRTTFLNGNKVPLPAGGSSWKDPVPNAFMVEGQTANSKTQNESASAWVETNPQATSLMQFPHGFIRIVLKKNTLQWNPDGIPADSTDYGFAPDTKDSTIPYVVGCGSMSGTSYCGYEYIPEILYKAVNALPPINGNTMDYLLQRCKEMVPGYTMAKLIAKMSICPISTDSSDQTFFIYPNNDNTDIWVMPESSAMLPSGCDSSATPEGSEQTLDTEGPIPLPNFATETFNCYGSYTFPTLSLESGNRKWKPGTGFNGGCLGELTVDRTTDVYLFGVCPCP